MEAIKNKRRVSSVTFSLTIDTWLYLYKQGGISRGVFTFCYQRCFVVVVV